MTIPGPHVDAGHLEPVVPRTRVRALALGPGAHAVPVGLAVLPAAAVRAAVVEIEPATVHQDLVGGGRTGGRGRRRRVTGQLLLMVRLQRLLLPVHVRWCRGRCLYGTPAAAARLQHRSPVGPRSPRRRVPAHR